MPTAAVTLTDHLLLMPFDSLLALAMIAVSAVAGLAIYAVLTISKDRGNPR